MIKRFRIFGTIATISTLAVAFSGPAGAADDRMERIEAEGKLRVCHAEDNPWTYRDPASGKWLGFTQDLAADLAADLGVELVDVDSTWKTIITSVTTNECDIGGGGLYATVARSKVVLFTIPYAYGHNTAVVHKESGYTSYEDLDKPDKLIISKAGGAMLEFAKRYFKHAEVKALVADTDAVALAEITNRRADALWTSTTKGEIFVKKNPQFNARVIGDEPLNYTPISWAINLGEYHFQNVLNVWLTNHIESGKTAVLWEKWFGTRYVRGD